MYLKACNLEDAKQEYAFFQAIQSEHGFVNDYYGISYESFINEVIPQRLNAQKGIGLNEGWVPDTHFFLWDEEVIVATFRIRHYLTDTLANGAGHIGYGVHPSYRGLGYATKGLHLAIEQAKNIIKEDEIYMSCHKDNPASLHVQLNNGAYIHHEDDVEYYTRIKVERL